MTTLTTMMIPSNNKPAAKVDLLLILLLSLITIRKGSAFGLLSSSSTSSSGKKSKNTKPINPNRDVFYKVLESMGKTKLRPGGGKANNKLFKEWATLSKNHHVLELGAALGCNAIDLANDYGCHVDLIDNDQSLLDSINDKSKKMGLQDLITTYKINNKTTNLVSYLEEDYHNIMEDDKEKEKPNKYYDCIVTARLSHNSYDNQKAILKAVVSKHLMMTPNNNNNDEGGEGGQILFHDICLSYGYDGDDIKTEDSPEAIQLKMEMSKALGVGFYPRTLDGWKQMIEETTATTTTTNSHSHLHITNIETGSLNVLNPITLLMDEGLNGFMRIVWNLFTNPDLRERVLNVRKVMSRHKHNLGYIIVRATMTTNNKEEEEGRRA